MEDLTGKQLGPYRIIEPLGEGGMAAVFKAYQASMDRYVAIKVLPRYYASDPEFVGRFKQEARVIARLQHPHILPVHDFGEDDGYTYLVMRFVESGTLAEWLKEKGALSLTEIRRIISQVGDALDYAHAQGVIHRDVKPSNILIDRRGNCLLTDFGLARMVESSVHFTQTGGILGTPAYMSPEQGMGKPIDHRSDIYSLGVVLYEMATGRPPFRAETPMAIVIKHIQSPLPPPRSYNPELPEPVERVILKALAKEPEDRFATAGEMVAALEAALLSPKTPTLAVEQEVIPTAVSPQMVPSSAPEEMMETAVASPEAVAAHTPPSATSAPKRKRSWRRILGYAVLGFLGLIIIGSILDSLDGNQPDFEQIMEQVRQASEAGNPEEVRDLLTQAIELQPDNAELYCERAYTLRDLGGIREAVSDFKVCAEKAAEQEEDDLAAEARAHAVLNEAYLVATEEDDLDGALEMIDQAIAREDVPPWLRCERAELNLQMQNFVDALGDFEVCAATNGDDPYWSERARSVVHSIKGGAALEEGDLETAVFHFQSWAEIQPDLPDPYCYLGAVLDLQHEYDAALDAYQQCQERANTEETKALSASGITYVEGHIAAAQENWPEALRAFNQALEITPDQGWLYCERAEAYLALSSIDEAQNDFNHCLETAGDDPDIQAWALDGLRRIEENH
ncbi:MAG: serine/threonine protein kinase [Chloroflexi bacterium]|nr:MAG: serine/threonine protein kinase [Chloroflexota bacterium]